MVYLMKFQVHCIGVFPLIEHVKMKKISYRTSGECSINKVQISIARAQNRYVKVFWGSMIYLQGTDTCTLEEFLIKHWMDSRIR